MALQELHAESFDLIYLDPPFFTQSTQRLRTRNRTREYSYKDLWASHSDYVAFLSARLEQTARVLKPTGSIFFHRDRNASHIARAVLDDVFGSNMFRSEIIWQYRRWSNSQRTLLPSHQTIYFYSKSEDYKFNTLYQDYSPSTNVDQILQRRERDQWGKSVYARDENGNVILNGDKRGVPLSDVWDIPYLNPKAKERTGYPTQKPVLLLERIIELCTDEGDWVLDPFCGSGTTLVAAALHGRNAVGIDISEDALSLARGRLAEPAKTDSMLLQKGRDAYQTAEEKALALLDGLDFVPVQRNQGIDAILREQVAGGPVPIRVQRENETIQEAARALHQAGRTKQAAVMVLVSTNSQEQLSLVEELPPEIIVVKAPARSIRDNLAVLKTGSGLLSLGTK